MDVEKELERLKKVRNYYERSISDVDRRIKDLEDRIQHYCWILSGRRFEKFSCYSVGKYLYTSFESGGGREREMKVQFCPICGMKAEEF